jgi:hypothetical protein
MYLTLAERPGIIQFRNLSEKLEGIVDCTKRPTKSWAVKYRGVGIM